MPRSCTVCRHPDREAIDVALGSGEALRAIGRRNGLTHRALARHRQGHLGGHDSGTASPERPHADGGLRRLQDALHQASDILVRGEQAPDRDSAVAAIREARAVMLDAAGNGEDSGKRSRFGVAREASFY